MCKDRFVITEKSHNPKDNRFAQLTKTEAKKFLDYVKLEDDKRNLRDLLEDALKNIKTSKQLEKHIPELVKFLPKEKYLMISMDVFDKLREKLK